MFARNFQDFENNDKRNISFLKLHQNVKFDTRYCILSSRKE